MKLFLIRHGQSKGNIKSGFISGRSDPEGLTSKGRSQIIRSAYELRKEKIDHILASPVARAQETAQTLKQYFSNTDIQTMEWLTELHHGVFEGYYWWEVIHKIPSEWRKHREDFTTAYPGGGESMKMLIHRVWKGLDNLLAQFDQKSRIIIVSHQATITGIRYCLEHGDPVQIKTEKQISSFLEYMHRVKLPNGGYVETQVSKGTTIEHTEFEPVKERKRNIAFYAKGVLSNSKIEAKRKQTASTNAVYHLTNATDHLLKILHAEDRKVVEHQVELYQYLLQKDLSVPHIEHHDSSRVFYKADTLIQDFIKGTDQNQCLQKHSGQMQELLKNIFVEVGKIHRIPRKEVEDFWIPPISKQFRDWKPFMFFNINMTLHHLAELSLGESIQGYVRSALRSLKNHIGDGDYALVPLHGDLAPENIIISHKKNTCKLVRIVDFEWARFGDRLWDLAYYWGWLDRADQKVSEQWHRLLSDELSTKQLDTLSWYRILFHAWTIRDMIEYEGDQLREERGERSREVLSLIHH